MPATGPSDPTNILATLTFTRTGIYLCKHLLGGAMTEYAIDPQQLTDLFSVKEPPPPPPLNSTGIILPSTVCVVMRGAAKVIVDYRPPQMTGIWMDDNPQPLRIPLPGLLLINKQTRTTNKYLMFAVKKRPITTNCDLYEPPLVHVGHGGLCWGNVTIPEEDSPNSLANAWNAFLGTPFTNHNVTGKSRRKKYANDIRALLIDLDKRKAKRYPVSDLVKIDKLENHLNINAGPWS